jgi:hypothetical protein
VVVVLLVGPMTSALMPAASGSTAKMTTMGGGEGW